MATPIQVTEILNRLTALDGITSPIPSGAQVPVIQKDLNGLHTTINQLTLTIQAQLNEVSQQLQTLQGTVNKILGGVPGVVPISAPAIVGEAVTAYDATTGLFTQASVGGGVTSVFGRTDAVTAQANDYNYSQIGASTAGIAVADSSLAGISMVETPVTGTVNVDGTGLVVTWVSGPQFVSTMVPGNITIGGIPWPISTFDSVTQLTLGFPFFSAPLTGAAYSFGSNISFTAYGQGFSFTDNSSLAPLSITVGGTITILGEQEVAIGNGQPTSIFFSGGGDMYIEVPGFDGNTVYIGTGLAPPPYSGGAGQNIQIGHPIFGFLGFFGATPIHQPTVTGSRTDGTALASLLTALASYGLIIDSTTA